MKTWYRFDFGNGLFIEKEFDTTEDFYDYIEKINYLTDKTILEWKVIEAPK